MEGNWSRWKRVTQGYLADYLGQIFFDTKSNILRISCGHIPEIVGHEMKQKLSGNIHSSDCPKNHKYVNSLRPRNQATALSPLLWVEVTPNGRNSYTLGRGYQRVWKHGWSQTHCIHPAWLLGWYDRPWHCSKTAETRRIFGSSQE